MIEENMNNDQKEQSRFTASTLQNLNKYTENDFNDPTWVPEGMQIELRSFLRKAKNATALLYNEREKYSKGSEEFLTFGDEIERVSKSVINLRDQLNIYKNSKLNFKNALPNINKGTKESDFLINSIIYGEAGNKVGIDNNGNINFAMPSGDGKDVEEESWLELDEVSDINLGSAPIITEPYGGKKFVWDMANKVKADKDSNIPLDREWINKSILNNFSNTGDNNMVGMAFTDLSADGRSKSFAEQYEEGLNNNKYYINPITGDKLPGDNEWMKDVSNIEVLRLLMSEYITDVMTDVYGPAVNEGTIEFNKWIKDPSKLAQNLIKKYSK